LERRAVGEPIERAREVGLEPRRRDDVDVAAAERVEQRRPVREEPDLEPAERGRAQRVALERGERDADAGEPGRDRERPGVDRLAGVLRASRRGRVREQMLR